MEVTKLKDTSVFQTDLKLVFDFLIRRSRGGELKELVHREPGYQELDEDAYDFISLYSNDNRLVEKKGEIMKGGKCNMCIAIDELMKILIPQLCWGEWNSWRW